MNTTYLSSEKLKGLKSYLSQVLPKDVVKVLQSLEAKGLQLDYEMDYRENNKNRFLQYIYNEITNNTDKEAEEFKKFALKAFYSDCRIIAENYISQHYSKEFKVIQDFKPKDIYFWLQSFCTENHIESIDLKALVISDSFDEYLSKYEAKSVDPQLMKITENIAKYIDSVYPQKRGEEAYCIYQEAIKQYMVTGDKQILHNILNKQY